MSLVQGGCQVEGVAAERQQRKESEELKEESKATCKLDSPE